MWSHDFLPGTAHIAMNFAQISRLLHRNGLKVSEISTDFIDLLWLQIAPTTSSTWNLAFLQPIYLPLPRNTAVPKKTTPQPHLGHCFLIAPLVKPGLVYNHCENQWPNRCHRQKLQKKLSNKSVNIHCSFMHVLAFTPFSPLFEYKACTTLGTCGAMISYQGLRTLQ